MLERCLASDHQLDRRERAFNRLQLDVARELAFPRAVRDLDESLIELERGVAAGQDRFGGALCT